MGNTTRREPVNFRIPASPDYKFFNVTDFRGLEMTDNPFIASNNTASDLLNVYVDENNALTTRPRLEKLYDIHNNIENFKEVLFSYKLLDRIVFQILLVDGSVKLYYKKDNNLTLIDNITNNITIPDTKIAVFEKDDKIYIMTGVLYCVMKADNILYNVENDVDTYVPTIGVSTVDNTGIRTLVDLEPKNILSDKYRIKYFWDTKSDVSKFIGENNKVMENGYVTRKQTPLKVPEMTKNYTFKICITDSKLLLYDTDSNIGYILEDNEITETFSITKAPVLSISSNGEWFLCGEAGSDLYVVDKENIVKRTIQTGDYKTFKSDYNKYYISPDGEYVLYVSCNPVETTDWVVCLNSKKIYTNTHNKHRSDFLSLYTNDDMRNVVLYQTSPDVKSTGEVNVGILYDIYSSNSNHEWFVWAGLQKDESSFPDDRPINIPAKITNDCSFIYRWYGNTLYLGRLIPGSKSFTYDFKYLDFVGKRDDIVYCELSSDKKLIYIIPRRSPAEYILHTHIEDVWAYSIEDDEAFRLMTLDKNPEKPGLFITPLADRFLTAASDLSSLFILSSYGDDSADDQAYVGSAYVYEYSLKTSKEPLLLVEYSKKTNTEEHLSFVESFEKHITFDDYSVKTIDLSDYENILSVTVKPRAPKTSNQALEKSSEYVREVEITDVPTDDFYRQSVFAWFYKWENTSLSFYLATQEEAGYPNSLLNGTLDIYINCGKKESTDKETTVNSNITHNRTLRFQNNFWFYGNGNNIRWTGNNDPTYLPEYNYTTLGDTADDVNDILLVSKDVAIAFKQNNFYVINPVTVSDTNTTYTFVEAKSDIGVIAPQSSIISPLKETPLYVNAKGIYGLELLKNVQSSDNVSVLYSENVNKKYLKEVNKFHIMSTSRLYWVLFIIPGKTSKVYVYDDRNSSWYYWELPINTAGCWSDDDTVYFVSKDGRVCDLKTNDIVDTKYSIETEYYDDGRKLIPWFWKSQILPLGTMNYSKKLINTTFILTDTDENEEYGLEYKFKAYRKIVSETNATRVSNRLTYIQSTTKKTTIPRFNFLQIELNNIEDDLNNNKLRLIGLGLKYELLEGLS